MLTQEQNSNKSLLGVLKIISRRLALSAAVLSGIGVFGLTVMTLTNIVIRRAGGGGVPDAVGWGEVGLAAIAFLGLAFTQHLNGHVSTTVVVRLLSPKTQHVITAIWMLVACVLILWVALETSEMAGVSFDRGESRFGTVPIWPAKISIAVSMWLLFLELVVNFLSHLFERKESPHIQVGSNAEAEQATANSGF